jgi:hypothetical protein
MKFCQVETIVAFFKQIIRDRSYKDSAIMLAYHRAGVTASPIWAELEINAFRFRCHLPVVTLLLF